MGKPKANSSAGASRRMRPALTPEARELQMISLAVDCAEEQMRNRTASAQVVTYYLKLASIREKLEREKLEKENELLRAKTKALESGERIKEMYENALNAMRRYSGRDYYEDEY